MQSRDLLRLFALPLFVVAACSDDTANPGMLAVLQGESLWSAYTGEAQRSCADCHGAAAVSMKGLAARYPDDLVLSRGSCRGSPSRRNGSLALASEVIGSV